MNKKLWVIGVVIVLIIASLFVFRGAFRSSEDVGEGSQNQQNTQSGGTDTDGKPAVSFVENNTPPPPLDQPMRPTTVLSEATRIQLDAKIKTIISSLKKNPKDTDMWLGLGLYAEMYTDYQRAKEIYEYVTKVDPNSYTAFHNLGNLYRAYLKDYEKAESNMKVVLDLSPSYTPEYISLSDLYRYNIAAKKDLADDVLLQGLQKNPKSTDLMIALAVYYSDMGDKVNARVYYQKALALAPNNTTIKADLEALGN